jgi:hypothetical protein
MMCGSRLATDCLALLLERLKTCHTLSSQVTMGTLTQFFSIANRILPALKDEEIVPSNLPDQATNFLSNVLGLPRHSVKTLWFITVDLLPEMENQSLEDEDDEFRRYAVTYQLSTFP